MGVQKGHGGQPVFWSCSLRDMMSVAVWIILIIVDHATGQFCQFENFNATCKAHQVVLMQNARYGRMQISRCVAKDYGHIGCSANVLGLLDKDCSGLRRCIFEISSLRDVIKPCPKDLTAYLEAEYTCIDVMKYKYNDCNKSIILSSKNNSVYISSDPLAKEHPNSVQCPINLIAQPGQRLNFTMYRFGHQNNNIDGGSHLCPLKVSFTAKGGIGKDVSECDVIHRQQVVYTSPGHQATVHFHNIGFGEEEIHNRVLLKVEATGCPNLVVPPNAWVERQGDKSIVKCNYTQETWYVTCTGTTWTGHVTNCTPATPEKGGGSLSAARKGHIPLGLVVAVTIGVILGVMFGIAMLITVFVYRRRRKSPKASKTTSLLSGAGCDEASQDNDENYSRRVWIEHKQEDSPYGRICRGHNAPPQYSSSNTDYSHMFELQCSARAQGLESSDYHVENPYGQCRRQVGGGRVSADDIHTCTMPLSSLATKHNAPSFATFKATDRSSLDRSPNKTLKVNKPRQEPPPVWGGPNVNNIGAGVANHNRSLASVAEVDDVTSPEHQPDVVTSSSSERGPGVFGLNERQNSNEL